MNGSLEYEDHSSVRKIKSNLEASSPQSLNKSAGPIGVGLPPVADHTLKTIEIMEDLPSIEVGSNILHANIKRRGAITQPDE